jgi:hypothetical protein
MHSGMIIVELVGLCWAFCWSGTYFSKYFSLHHVQLWSLLGAQGSTACCVCNSEGQQTIDE